MKINLVMPMGGAGTRVLNNGFDCPKPLLDLKGRPFFAWAADSVRTHMDLCGITYVVLQDHIDRFSIDKRILEYDPGAQIRVLPEVLNGAVLTCMEGAKAIQNEAPVIFCDCDLMFTSESLYEYYGADSIDADGTLVTFRSELPRYSFIRRDEEGFVAETVEKKVISNEAICGAYGFGNKEIFLRYAEQYLTECSYQEFFMSGVYNLMVSDGRKVRAFETDTFISFGTPEEYTDALSRL